MAVGPRGGEPAPPPGDIRALGSILRSIRANSLLVAAVLSAAVLAGVAVVSIRSPTYEATARLLVTPLAPDERSLRPLPLVRQSGDPTRTMQTAAALIDRPDIAALAASRLGPGWTPQRLQDTVEVRPEGQTDVLAITAVTHDPELSRRAANAYALAVLDARRRDLARRVAVIVADLEAQLRSTPGPGDDVTGELRRRLAELRVVGNGTDPTLALLQLAVRPTDPNGPASWLLIAVALLAGGVLAVAAAVVIDVVTPARARHESELVAVYPLPVLARLPRQRAWRRGAKPLHVPASAEEPLRTLHAQLELQDGRHRIIMVTSPSHRDGKTTTALQFALTLLRSDQRVILVDLDRRRPALGPLLGIASDHDVDVRLVDEDDEGDAGDGLIDVPGLPGLRMLTLRRRAGTSRAEELHTVSRMVEVVLAFADYIIVDAPALGEFSDALRLVRAVDDVLLVARLGHTMLSRTEAVRDVLERAGAQPTGLVVIGSPAQRAGSYHL